MAAQPVQAVNGTTLKQSIPPNQTLYIQNLPPKITKQDLRMCLYTLFATYGPVLDVVALKTPKMRQQAHVVFRDVNAASAAMRALQGTGFLGRDLRIQYAKGKSDTVAKLDGTYKMPMTVQPQTEPVSTQFQKQVFGGPPSAAANLPNVPPPPNPQTIATKTQDEREGTPQGVKRPREESDEEAAMEEDSDAPMEEDSDDD